MVLGGSVVVVDVVVGSVVVVGGIVVVVDDVVVGVLSKECQPSPSTVSTGKPSHSMAGSNESPPSVSPVVTEGLRRRVLSAVLVAPEPHSLPGSAPIRPITSRIWPSLRNTMASSPLNDREPEVKSATSRIDVLAEGWAST